MPKMISGRKYKAKYASSVISRCCLKRPQFPVSWGLALALVCSASPLRSLCSSACSEPAGILVTSGRCRRYNRSRMRRLTRVLCYGAVSSIALGSMSVFGHDSNTKYAQWFNSLMKPDFPLSSCCGVADQYYVREYQPSKQAGIAFTAIVINQDGQSEFAIDVPKEKVIWDRVNPTGRGVIFIDNGDWVSRVVCFVPSVGM